MVPVRRTDREAREWPALVHPRCRCNQATDHAVGNGGKPWKYVLIPHNAITANMTLEGLVALHSL
jgi:hypothetical protein